ncbi:MAG: YCF48-related protein [Thermodesulfobacteriota bacterium]|nr:YCF48-related protein [Thermodesulfobacteriota bacterium]
MQTKKIFLFMLSAAFLVYFILAPAISYADKNASIPLSGNLFASAVISEGSYIIVGDRGKIYFTNDAAETWKVVDSKTKNALASVSFSDDRNGWIAGQDGVILHSADGGKTWEHQVSGVNKYLLAVDFLDATNGVAVGADSAVIMTADGGKTWTKSPFKLPSDFEEDSDISEEFNLFTVKMMDAWHICIAGDGGRIFITEDAGKTWITAKSPLYDEEMMEGKILYSMAYDSGTIYAVGIDGTFIYSKDQGKTWTEASSGITEPEIYCIDVAGGIGLAAGSGGNIIRTSDRGETWHTVKVPEEVTQAWLSGITLKKCDSGTVKGLIVGQNGTVGIITDSKLVWQ